MSLLQLECVSKRFDGVTAVDGVSFTVDRGQVVGFLGPNGAGKTTTMRMITQAFEPDSGWIRIDGTLIADAPREAKRHIGFLPENNPLYTDMIASDYLEFIGRLRELRGSELRRAIHDAVDATGIAPVFNRPIGDASKGYRQRIGLAAAILHKPSLLVLDEPTEGLDPNQRVEIRRLIADLGRERTVMLSTHVLPEVQHTCTRVVIINRGRLVADGKVDDLITKAGQGARVSVEAIGHDVAAKVGNLPGVRAVELRDSAPGSTRVVLSVAGNADVRPDVFELARSSGWVLLELHQERASLEDLFHDLTSIDQPVDAAVSATPTTEVAA